MQVLCRREVTLATAAKAGGVSKHKACLPNPKKNVLLVDAVVERAVDHAISFINDLSYVSDDDDSKRIQRAAESLVAVLNARNPPTDATSFRRVAISEESVKSVFHLPISQAAKELGVGLTVLKKYCRIYEISRWPFRKLKSLDKLVSTVSSIEDSSSVLERSMVARGLVDKKAQMQLEPSIELDREIKRIRQAAYKLEHRKRRENGTSGAPSS